MSFPVLLHHSQLTRGLPWPRCVKWHPGTLGPSSLISLFITRHHLRYVSFMLKKKCAFLSKCKLLCRQGYASEFLTAIPLWHRFNGPQDTFPAYREDVARSGHPRAVPRSSPAPGGAPGSAVGVNAADVSI